MTECGSVCIELLNCEDYFFKGSFTKTYMQIGNSVPPIMARTIAEAILPYVVGVEMEDEQLVLGI